MSTGRDESGETLELGISLRRVMAFLEEAGESVPGYLMKWNEPGRELETCPHCRKTA